jgi:hypothetical protein
LALPLCGRRARGKPCVGRFRYRARAGIRRDKRPASYARYPCYPQADSAWNAPAFVTAMGRGRDDLPATEDSLPSHSPGQDRAGCLRAARRIEADGRAADEAAARRTMAGLPFSGCESGRLREAPTGDQIFRGRGTVKTGHRTQVQDLSRQKARLRPARCHRRKGSFGFQSVGQDRSFGFGGCENGRDPGLRLMDLPGGTRASALDPAGRGTEGFGWRNRQGKEAEPRFQIRQAANRRGLGPDGEPDGETGSSFGSLRTPEDARPGLRP